MLFFDVDVDAADVNLDVDVVEVLTVTKNSVKYDACLSLCLARPGAVRSFCCLFIMASSAPFFRIVLVGAEF